MATNIRDLKVRIYGRLVANHRREDLRADVNAWVLENYGPKALD